MEYPVFLMMGKPGSGKDSNADLLVQKIPELVSVGSGKVILDWIIHGVAHQDDEASAYKPRYEAGEYLDDEATMRIFLPTLERIVREAGKQGAIVNGFPRTLAQVAGIPYENILGVLVLDVPDEVAYERMLKRPGRVDKHPETLKKRLETYHKTVPQIINYYYDAGVPVYEFDGKGDLAEVFPAVLACVETIWTDYARSLVKRS